MSSDVTGRRAANGRATRAVPGGSATPAVEVPGSPASAEAPVEVLDFVRHCYRRRGIGWPELYDEMCAVAARGGYRGMDYEALAALGIGFSLGELPRLAAIAQRVAAEERAARAPGARRVADPASDPDTTHVPAREQPAREGPAHLAITLAASPAG